MTKKQNRLQITLKLYKKGKEVYSARFRKRRRFYRIIQEVKFESAYIKVRYPNSFHNDGIYHDKKELIRVFRIFTEKELVDYFYKERS